MIDTLREFHVRRPHRRVPGFTAVLCLLYAAHALDAPSCYAAPAGGPGAAAEPGLIVSISLPKPNSLVRANIPVFGKAYGPSFKLWRLEFGEGLDPDKWNLIKAGFKPILEDPWEANKVEWNPDWGAHGNLADWGTGLVSYSYGTQHANLNGVFTLRLVAEDKDGNAAEARVPVEVGRVITRPKGGTANSPDNRIVLSVPPMACPHKVMVVSIQPSDDVKPGPGLEAVGKIYEFRPPGKKFARPATLTITYADEDLDTNGDGRPDVPEGKLAACYYRPVEEYWAVLPAKHFPDENKFVASLSSVTPHLAYFAVLADAQPPEPPQLGQLPKIVNGSSIAVEGLTEPEAEVCMTVNGQMRHTTRADVDGYFAVPGLRLDPGRNRVEVAATDGFGNRGKPVRVQLERVMRPPKSVKSVTILGRRYATHGERFLVHLSGQDADPEVNTCQARVVSETDPKGIVLELRETEPASGDYVVLFQVQAESDPARSHLAARRHGESVTAFAVADPAKRDRKTYHDVIPPPPPGITSASHPSAFQDTFEGQLPGLLEVAARDGLAAELVRGEATEFRGLDGERGAVVERVDELGNAFVDDMFETASGQPANCFMRMTRPRRGQSHMGVVAKATPYSLSEFPMLEFDYRIQPGTKIDMVVHVGEGAESGKALWYNVGMNDVYSFHKRIGSFAAIKADGKWRHAQVNLHALVARVQARLKNPTVREIQFVDWDVKGFMVLKYGASHGRKEYCIDNLAATRWSDQPQVAVQFSSNDANGIAGRGYQQQSSWQQIATICSSTRAVQCRHDVGT